MAGKITYIAPVEKASGKIFGKKSRFVAVTRKSGSRPNGCAVTGVRSTPVKASEKAQRQKFGYVTSAARERMQDPQQLVIDQAAYAAVKHQYNSFWHYVFKQVWNEYEG